MENSERAELIINERPKGDFPKWAMRINGLAIPCLLNIFSVLLAVGFLLAWEQYFKLNLCSDTGCYLRVAIFSPFYIVQLFYTILWTIVRIQHPPKPADVPMGEKRIIFWLVKFALFLALLGTAAQLDIDFRHTTIWRIIYFSLAKLGWLSVIFVSVINVKDKDGQPSFVRVFLTVSAFGLIGNIIYRGITDANNHYFSKDDIVRIVNCFGYGLLAFLGWLGKIYSWIETPRYKGISRQTSHVLKLLKSEKFLFMVGVITSFFQGSSYILSLYYTGHLIGNAQYPETFHFDLIIFAGLAGFSSILRGIQVIIFGALTERFNLFNKKELMNAALVQDNKFLKSETSWLQTLLTVECSQLGGLMDNFGKGFNSLGKIITSVIVLFYISWELSGLLLLITAVVMSFVTWKTISYSSSRKNAVQNEDTILSDKTREIVESIPTIKRYGTSKYEFDQFSNLAEKVAKVGISKAKGEGVFEGIEYLLYAATSICGLLFGSKLVSQSLITLPQLTSFGLISSPFMSSVWEIIQFIKDFGDKFYLIIDNMLKLLSHHPNTKADGIPSSGLVPPINIPNRSDLVVEFDRVSLEVGQKTLVKNVDFSLKRGEVMALVGESGSGKSTCISLLLRERLSSSGAVKILGNDITNLSIQTLYQHVVVVSPEDAIFNGTLRTNICYGSTTVKPEEELKKILLATGLDDLGSIINTATISQSERQRIVIARALLKEPKPLLMIFDEVTSALDEDRKKRIMEAVYNYLKENRIASIIITHHLQTTKTVDKIVVLSCISMLLEGASVAETGSYSKLIEKKGLYYRLFT